jgi:hypothetical protein
MVRTYIKCRGFFYFDLKCLLSAGRGFLLSVWSSQKVIAWDAWSLPTLAHVIFLAWALNAYQLLALNVAREILLTSLSKPIHLSLEGCPGMLEALEQEESPLLKHLALCEFALSARTSPSFRENVFRLSDPGDVITA